MTMSKRHELRSLTPTDSPITIDLHTRIRIYSDMEGEMSYQNAQESASVEPQSPRRSARLQAMGYYNEDGQPKVLYKERLQSTFKRRRKTIHNTPPFADSDSDFPMAHVVVEKSTFRYSWLIFVLFFFAMFGVTTYMMHQMISSRSNDVKTLRLMEIEIRDLRNELQKFPPKALLLPNFALDVHGAYVATDLSSKTYQSEGMIWASKQNAPWLKFKTPCYVISGQIYPLIPGHCWPFEGEKGHIFISLAHKIHITHVSLGHISRAQSPSGQTLGAPKQFTVYGLETLRGEATRLGTFEYNNEGDSFQTFEIVNHRDKVFQYVRLQVETNHGHPTYTCLYNFKVHGHMP